MDTSFRHSESALLHLHEELKLLFPYQADFPNPKTELRVRMEWEKIPDISKKFCEASLTARRVACTVELGNPSVANEVTLDFTSKQYAELLYQAQDLRRLLVDTVSKVPEMKDWALALAKSLRKEAIESLWREDLEFHIRNSKTLPDDENVGRWLKYVYDPKSKTSKKTGE